MRDDIANHLRPETAVTIPLEPLARPAILHVGQERNGTAETVMGGNQEWLIFGCAQHHIGKLLGTCGDEPAQRHFRIIFGNVGFPAGNFRYRTHQIQIRLRADRNGGQCDVLRCQLRHQFFHTTGLRSQFRCRRGSCATGTANGFFPLARDLGLNTLRFLGAGTARCRHAIREQDNVPGARC